MKIRHAFTLIEMLVVIAIIGIVAALVVGMAARAKEMQRKAQVDASKHSIILSIDSYQAKLNFFPPDNAKFTNATVLTYDAMASTNPLLYELTGTKDVGLNTVCFDVSLLKTVFYPALSGLYSRGIVNNSNPDEPHSFYSPHLSDYTNYDANTPTPSVLKGLLVPVLGKSNPQPTDYNYYNFWHYDSSTTNRHNPSSYDLWAEFVVGNKNGADIIITNGNW